MRRRGTLVASALLLVLGAAVIIRSLAAGVGGGLGLALGVLFCLAGGFRLYLHTR